jgi:hypothetical protein
MIEWRIRIIFAMMYRYAAISVGDAIVGAVIYDL